MSANFIITQDKDTISKLERSGYRVLTYSYGDGMVVFYNDTKTKPVTFDQSKVVFTDKLNFGG